ncbi:MAG: hypothetical protein JJ911_10465 [Rhizobiaceae bacterium]|nr:hypothetical protein [Rhizobiaceae bacterium]
MKRDGLSAGAKTRRSRMPAPLKHIALLFGALSWLTCNLDIASAQATFDVGSIAPFGDVTKNTYFLTYTTFGTEEIGPSVGAFGAALPGVLGPGSQVNMAFVLAGPSVDGLPEAGGAGFRYRQKLASAPHLSFFVEADAVRVRLGSARGVAVGALGWRANMAVGVQRETALTPTSRLSMTLEFERRRTTAEVLGTSALDERLYILHGRLVYSSAQSASSRRSIELEISKGLDAFGSTGNANPLASRPGAAAAFLKASVTASATLPIAATLSFKNNIHAQWADRALPVSQRCGYGTNVFSRGFDTSFIGGDQCIALSHEIAFNVPAVRLGKVGLAFLQPYAALDYGITRDLGGAFGASPIGRWSNVSAGIRFGTKGSISELSLSRILLAPTGRPEQPATRAWFRSAVRF